MAREKNGRFYVAVRFGKKERAEYRVPSATNAEEADARQIILSEAAEALVTAGRRDLVPETLRQLAEASSPARLTRVRAAVKAIVDGAVKAGHSREITFKQWGDRYTSGELSKLWPDYVRAKDWSDDASRLRKYVYKLVGGVPVTAFTFEHAARVMADLPATMQRDANRRHVAQVMGRLMHLAVFPGRLIATSPLPRGWLPKIKDRLHYTCLFPREEKELLQASAIPGVFRLFCGVLNREGMRLSELLDSTWDQWNLTEGTFSVRKTKTGDPRMWAVRPDVAIAMRLWKEHAGAARPFAGIDALILAKGGKGKGLPDRTKLAGTFRAALKAAGVDRVELFTTTEHTGKLRAHDMRATFVTTSLAEGKSDTWIRDRTAHKSTSMIDRYRRAARQFAELNLGSLADLADALGWRKDGGTKLETQDMNRATTIENRSSTEEGTRTLTPFQAADFESVARYPDVAGSLETKAEADVSRRAPTSFRHPSASRSDTSRGVDDTGFSEDGSMGAAAGPVLAAAGYLAVLRATEDAFERLLAEELTGEEVSS